VDFWDLTKLMVRRWRIALPLLVLTIVAVVIVGLTARSDYRATSHVSLVPPVQADEGVARSHNPWLNTSLSSLAAAAIITVQSKSVADGLAASGFSRSYTLTLAGPSEPIVTIEVVAPTQAKAIGTARELARLLDQSVASIQTDSDISGRDLITTLRIPGDTVEASSTAVVRAMITVGALGVLVTAATTIGADALIRRRRSMSPRASGTPIQTYARDAASPGRSRGHLSRPSSLPTGRPLPIGSGVTRHDGGPAQEIHRVEADPPTDPGLVVPPPDAIDSTIVLPLTAPSAWPSGERGKRT
jgi:hypothetical protein